MKGTMEKHMKTKTRKNTRKTRRTDSWNRAAAKGALVWGSVYSTATSGAAYLLAPAVTGTTPAFSDIFLDSLVIFPTAGAARGLVMWRMRRPKNTGLDAFTSKRMKHRRPLTARRPKAA